jgi:hypothetical protein
MLDYWKQHHSAIMGTIIFIAGSNLLPAGIGDVVKVLATLLQPYAS